jgi:hypothetical protein
MQSNALDQQWRLIRARENLSAQTIERFRHGLPIRNASLARIIRAVEALDMRHLLTAGLT